MGTMAQGGAPRPNYNPFDVALTLSTAPPPPAPASAQYTPGGYVPPPFALQEQPNASTYQPGSYNANPPAGAPAGGALPPSQPSGSSAQPSAPYGDAPSSQYSPYAPLASSTPHVAPQGGQAQPPAGNPYGAPGGPSASQLPGQPPGQPSYMNAPPDQGAYGRTPALGSVPQGSSQTHLPVGAQYYGVQAPAQTAAPLSPYGAPSAQPSVPSAVGQSQFGGNLQGNPQGAMAQNQYSSPLTYPPQRGGSAVGAQPPSPYGQPGSPYSQSPAPQSYPPPGQQQPLSPYGAHTQGAPSPYAQTPGPQSSPQGGQLQLPYGAPAQQGPGGNVLAQQLAQMQIQQQPYRGSGPGQQQYPSPVIGQTQTPYGGPPASAQPPQARPVGNNPPSSYGAPPGYGQQVNQPLPASLPPQFAQQPSNPNLPQTQYSNAPPPQQPGAPQQYPPQYGQPAPHAPPAGGVQVLPMNQPPYGAPMAYPPQQLPVQSAAGGYLPGQRPPIPQQMAQYPPGYAPQGVQGQSLPPPQQDEQQTYREWFAAIDGERTGRIDANALQQALRAGGDNFSCDTVNLMVQMFGKNGGIDIEGFVGLFKYIQAIRTSFETLDKNKTGSLSAEEIKHAITKANFVFKNQQTFDAIFNRYDRFKDRKFLFADYMEIAVKLGNTRNQFLARDSQGTGNLHLNFEHFVALCVEL